MTEFDAKQKWCPFVRVLDGLNRNSMSGDYAESLTNCIGSACMMWRWEELEGEVYSDEQGYCGLAGKP